MSDIRIIALEYLEPYYERTRKAIEMSGLPVTYADRQGVGNFSRAFNEAVSRPEVIEKYLWFITDITFHPEVPQILARSMEFGFSALHPQHMSDHRSHRPKGVAPRGGWGFWKSPVQAQPPEEVKFIEFTAPMVDREWWDRVGGLDEDHHYWYMDLVFSHSVRQRGGRLGVDRNTFVQHTYRRDDVQYPVTAQRYELRKLRDPLEQQLLVDKFGPDWRNTIWHV